MNARFTNSLVKSSILVVAMATVLSGCGGSGANAGGNVATKLAASYTLELVEAPSGSSGIDFLKVSPNGTIGGQWYTENGSTCFNYKNGVRTDVTPENSNFRLASVSDSGTIEGSYVVGNDLFPFSTTGTGFHDITKPGSYTEGFNAGRDASGRSYLTLYDASQNIEAYREKSGVYTPLTVADGVGFAPACSSPSGYAAGLAFFNGTYKQVRFTPESNVGTTFLEDVPNAKLYAINDLGSVGGWVKEGSNFFPFVNVNGQTTQLAGLGGDYGQISDLNSGNVAVGYSKIAGNGSYRAIGWSATDGQVDLTTRIPSTPGFVLYRAYGIDNKGRIIGTGFLNGKSVGFIMTPVTP